MDTMLEHVVMEIVATGGLARSSALEAIKAAREGQLEKAEQLMFACDESLNRAHMVQTEIVQKEARGQKMEVSLLMVHAQDHLMNAMTVRDLAIEIIALYTLKEVIG